MSTGLLSFWATSEAEVKDTPGGYTTVKGHKVQNAACDCGKKNRLKSGRQSSSAYKKPRQFKVLRTVNIGMGGGILAN